MIVFDHHIVSDILEVGQNELRRRKWEIIGKIFNSVVSLGDQGAVVVDAELDQIVVDVEVRHFEWKE